MSSYLKQRGSALVILLSVAAVLVVAGAIVFVLMSKKDGDFSLASTFHRTITATTASEVRTLLTDAKAGKYDAKCTYLLKSVESTLYVKGDSKMRVDTAIADKPGHFVRIGDSMYVWADGNPKGSILPISDDNEDGEYTPDGFASKVEEYNVKCESVGHLSESLFTPPPNVTFTDFKIRSGAPSSSETE